ncbi:MAG: protein phosphatase 2C domain-containing protein [Anaerolineaceae bacterium]|jgi:protein phosphatase|nr:protein phosphatase 2C domain-containing protein [Anaerolineaceae bacterium]
MKQIEQAHLPIAAQTHPGMSGKNNEDSFAVSACVKEDHNETPVVLAVLCDGIGGHRAGEVASELAVNRISQRVVESDGNHILETMESAIQEAGQEIYDHAQADEARHGMGATCAAACIVGNRLYTATVGDSRIYLMRGENISQLSIDHTWIQEALQAGIMTPEQVEGHPNAHVIRRYLGSPTVPEVDLRLTLRAGESSEDALDNQGLPLLNEDMVLLCSDGLSDLVKAEEILTVCHNYSLDQVPQALIDLANARGGHDNITVVIARMTEAYASKPKPRLLSAPVNWKSLATAALIVIGLAIVLGLAVGGWLWLRDRRDGDIAPGTAVEETLQLTQPVGQGTPMPEWMMQPTAGEEEIVLPAEMDDGPTLTPWPTHTLQVSATLPVIPSFTPTP